MKKAMAATFVLLLILTAIFLWKGGHHALYLAWAADELLDAESSTQQVTLQVNGTSLSGNTFWMEQRGERIFGVRLEGFGFYLRDDILFTESGLSYSLPDSDKDEAPLRRLLTGAVLYGRITKSDGVYHFQMDTGELSAVMSAPEDLRSLSLSCTFSANGQPVTLDISLLKSDERPVLPTAVADSMVRAEMETPISIREPLETALGAAEALFPLSAELTLGVDCGILELSEKAAFRMDGKTAQLERDGAIVTVSLPGELSRIPTEAFALLLLHSGEFSQSNETAAFAIRLSPETTGELITQLVPQSAELGIEYDDSSAVLTVQRNKLTHITMTANGSVPFLITTIPLSFSAQLDID